MDDGRLIRMGKYRGDEKTVVFVVAIANPHQKPSIRSGRRPPRGRGSGFGPRKRRFAAALKLLPGEFIALMAAAERFQLSPSDRRTYRISDNKTDGIWTRVPPCPSLRTPGMSRSF